MRLAAAVVVCLLSATSSPAATPAPPRGAIFLAGQRIEFDAKLTPHFTTRQIRGTDAATRAGLLQLARTARGRKLLAWFTSGEYEIDVREDDSEDETGDAPEPGIATLLAANDHTIVKKYSISLNPRSLVLPPGVQALAGQATTAADGMAAGWAAELLHVYYYTRGIRLPHHTRDDFQDEWRAIVFELGFPTFEHTDASAR